MTGRRNRIVAIGVPIALVVGGTIAGRGVLVEPVRASWEQQASAAPAAPPADQVGSNWFCGSGTITAGTVGVEGSMYADATIVLTNTSDTAATGQVTVMPQHDAGREAVVVPMSIPAGGQFTLRYGDVLAPLPSAPDVPTVAQFASSFVELDQGGVIAERVVSGSSGSSQTPCSSSGSTEWYFADGTTVRESTYLIALSNPFPEPATATFNFWTEEGLDAPSSFSALTIPPNTVRIVDVGAGLRRREIIGTTIDVTQGRVVADRIIQRLSGRPGLFALNGSPTTATEWFVPNTVVGPAYSYQLSVYNTEPVEALVTLRLIADDAEVEPIELSVAPNSVLRLPFDDPRIPQGVGLSVIVESTTGQGIVVQRSLDILSVKGGVRSDMLASPISATAWATGYGGTSGGLNQAIVMQNVAEDDAVVSIEVVTEDGTEAIAGLENIQLGQGRRTVIVLDDYLDAPSAALIVRSTVGIVVERSTLDLSSNGFLPVIPVALSGN